MEEILGFLFLLVIYTVPSASLVALAVAAWRISDALKAIPGGRAARAELGSDRPVHPPSSGAARSRSER